MHGWFAFFWFSGDVREMAMLLWPPPRMRHAAVHWNRLSGSLVAESEKLVRNLFEMARENAPSIIFIDEVLHGASYASIRISQSKYF